jgi:hypothetical protein
MQYVSKMERFGIHGIVQMDVLEIIGRKEKNIKRYMAL